MYYRVESAALPRVRTFKDYKKALAFARALAEKTAHEVQVVLVSGGWNRHHVLHVFNKKVFGSE
jgi:pterin-4a-carbinolamine dehydratase